MGKAVYKESLGRFEEGVIVGNELWYVAVPIAWLCKMNLSDYQAELVCELPPQEGLRFGYSYNVVAVYQNQLILMPKCAQDVLIYYMDQGAFKKIELKEALITNEKGIFPYLKFRSHAKEGNTLWMMPQASCCIIEYNMVTGVLTEHSQWYEQLEPYGWDSDYLFGKGVLAGEALWLPCRHLNALLEFSTKTKSAKLHHIGQENARYVAIACINGELWLLNGKDNVLFRWNPETEEIEDVISLPEDYCVAEDVEVENEKNLTSVYMKVMGNKLVLIPALANQFLSVDIESRKICRLLTTEKGDSFVACVADKNRLICPSHNSSKIVTIYPQEERAGSTGIFIAIDTKCISRESVFFESEIHLEKTLRVVDRHKKNDLENSNKGMGAIIYKALM